MRAIPLIALALIAVGCGASSNFVEREYVEVNDDPYSAETEYLGITHQDTDGPAIGGYSYNTFFRSWLDDETGEVEHQLYVNVYYMASQWRFFNRAAFEGGQEADFVRINRNVENCTGYGPCAYNEVFGIMFTPEMMEEKSEGSSLKIYADSGHELILPIASEQVNAQLNLLTRNEDQ